jgi:hypothetical protein
MAGCGYSFSAQTQDGEHITNRHENKDMLDIRELEIDIYS